ncbi:unnamed protein product [Vicia faba]|uniref:Uncharacterized protein n=1 Tax=Vicia faba TaxID=3906 RepID=A0AAV0ZLX5_VICFA|nr:unnamed protein product [Vicia faba]
MEQIKENQVAFKEDLEQVKSNIDSMKGDMSQVLLALKNIIERQEQIPRVAFEEVAQTIGASSGHQPRREPVSGPLKSTIAQQEVRQVDTEGFVPPPPKVGASHSLHIPVNNADNYIDLQYGDINLKGATQTHQPKMVENPLALNQYKILKKG